MAEEIPSLQIDTDWKKQAQEEKRRLAEQSASKPVTAVTPTAPPVPGAPKSSRRAAAETPAAAFSGLVQSMLTQTLYYLGDIATAAGQARVDLDMARYQVDLLTMLDEKTKGNLTPEESTLLDAAMYESRNRFIAVASQMLGP